MKFCKIPKISATRNIYKQPLNMKLNKQNIKTKTNLCSPKVCTVEFRIAIFGIYPWTNLERCLLSRKLPAAGMEKMSPYLKMVYTKTNLVLSKKF